MEDNFNILEYFVLPSHKSKFVRFNHAWLSPSGKYIVVSYKVVFTTKSYDDKVIYIPLDMYKSKIRDINIDKIIEDD